jgi:tRNA 2-thiocytidine biosynthesis protein TtcA
MIRPGDRVLVGLSGGKDSLLLLHALRQLQLGSPPGHFSLGVCTVDPGTSAFDPRPLVGYVAALGLPMHYVATPIFDTAATAMQGDSICAFCARLKRGALYCAAREHGYNVLALGQHLDDMAESFLMSALYNGLLRTMKGAYRVDARDLRVIRPLMHVRERETRAFAYGCGLPVIADNCPACFEAPKERRHVKKLLAAQEAAFPDTFARLATAMAPLNEPAVSDVLAIVRRREADPRASRARVRAREGGRGVGAGLEDAGPEAQLLGLVALVDEVQPLSAPQRELLAGLGDATLLAELARRQSARRGARAAELRGGKGDEDDDDESGVPTGPCAGGACPLPRRADE